MALSHRRLVLVDPVGGVGKKGYGGGVAPTPLRKAPTGIRFNSSVVKSTPTARTASRIPVTKSPSRKASTVSTSSTCSGGAPSPLNDLSWKFSCDSPASSPTPAAIKAPPIGTKSGGSGRRSEEDAIQGLQELVRRQQEELEAYRGENPLLLSSALVKQAAEHFSVQVTEARYDGPLQVQVEEDPRLAATRSRLNQRLQHLLEDEAAAARLLVPHTDTAAADPDTDMEAEQDKQRYHQEIRQLLQTLRCDAYPEEPVYAVSSKRALAQDPTRDSTVENEKKPEALNAPLEQNVYLAGSGAGALALQDMHPDRAETEVARDQQHRASDDDSEGADRSGDFPSRGSALSLESSSDATSGDDGIGKECRPGQGECRDLSMDSGIQIQGSSCDLDASADSSSASDTLDDDEDVLRPTLALLPAGAGGGGGGEAFNAVEELYVADAVHRVFTETHFDSAPDLAAAGSSSRSRPEQRAVVFLSAPGGLNRIVSATCQQSASVSSAILDGMTDLPPHTISSSTALQQVPSLPSPPEPFRRAQHYHSRRVSSADDVFRSSLPLRHSLPAKPPRTPSVRLSGSIKQLYEAAPAQAVLSASGEVAPEPPAHEVVVAIDFGTTYSGYAFCYTRDPDANIHMMRKWEGGDPGLHNEKAPSTLLLSPEGKFHSFGFLARDTFHDLHPDHAKRWLFFDKFKMALLSQTTLSRDTTLAAANGRLVPALTVLALSLRYLRERALAEITAASASSASGAVRWVLTVPALWGPSATQLLREAAHQAGLASPENPEEVLIVLEPEAASLCCRQLRLHQLLGPAPATTPASAPASLVLEPAREGTQYMVVDCGGGTVDITVHELSGSRASLRELHKASGGACGSLGVDREFERLLCAVFGADFMSQFRRKRPAAYVELLLAFEARKRSAEPERDATLNIFPPFAFVEAYRKFRGKEVEHAVRKFGRPSEVSWSSQGMLRLSSKLMADLFHPTLDHICSQIEDVLRSPRLRGLIQYMFLVGGFSQSLMLQHRVRHQFGERVQVVVPQGVGLTTLRGAVLYGLDPALVVSRRSKHTIGVGVLKRFQPGEHPQDKLVRLSDGSSWCCDVLDVLVLADQPLGPGETVTRSYTPASARQTTIIIHIYCSTDSSPSKFVTDPGVSRCGTLRLSLTPASGESRAREIVARIEFGGTELAASAQDITSGHCVRTQLDFLNTAV